MAENKQYIYNEQENGSVMISEDVVIAIAEQAISEVEGVVGLSTKPGADIVEMIGKKSWGRGIKVTIGEDNALSVDCNIIVAYGQSVVDVASAVQSSVCAALESTTCVKVSNVNVNVCSIVRQ